MSKRTFQRVWGVDSSRRRLQSLKKKRRPTGDFQKFNMAAIFAIVAAEPMCLPFLLLFPFQSAFAAPNGWFVQSPSCLESHKSCKQALASWRPAPEPWKIPYSWFCVESLQMRLLLQRHAIASNCAPNGDLKVSEISVTHPFDTNNTTKLKINLYWVYPMSPKVSQFPKFLGSIMAASPTRQLFPTMQRLNWACARRMLVGLQRTQQ